jgi:hypothetical protein
MLQERQKVGEVAVQVVGLHGDLGNRNDERLSLPPYINWAMCRQSLTGPLPMLEPDVRGREPNRLRRPRSLWDVPGEKETGEPWLGENCWIDVLAEVADWS